MVRVYDMNMSIAYIYPKTKRRQSRKKVWEGHVVEEGTYMVYQRMVSSSHTKTPHKKKEGSTEAEHICMNLSRSPWCVVGECSNTSRRLEEEEEYMVPHMKPMEAMDNEQHT